VILVFAEAPVHEQIGGVRTQHPRPGEFLCKTIEVFDEISSLRKKLK